MKEQYEESISALLDGEAVGDPATLERLLDDETGRHCWARYSLIGDVLRGDRIDAVDLSRRVAEALADERPLLAVVADSAPDRGNGSRLRALGGLALAASLATVAILGGRALEYQVPPAAGVAEVASAENASPTGTPMMSPVGVAPGDSLDGGVPPGMVVVRTLEFPGSRGGVPTVREKRLQWNVSQPAVQERLNAYLVDYSGHLGTDLRGMLPYARVVGYDGRLR